MKLSKVLFSTAVMAAAMTAFVACAQDDDPNGMISGSNNNYTLDYTNETKEISRGYNTSNLKHAGALVKINFEKVGGTGGMMGFMFDYEKTGDLSSFNIIGVRSDGVYYISRFENITTEGLQGNNFGATTTADAAKGEAKETEFVKFNSTKLPNFTDKTAYLWIIQSEDGSDYKVYSLTKEVAEKAVVADANNGVLKNESGEDIVLSGSLTSIPTGYKEQIQKRYGVYANVYAESSVLGTWEILGSYKAADVVAD